MSQNINQSYLPTIEELEGMSNLDFIDWIDRAEIDLHERKVMRDPLSHLKKQIFQVIQQNIDQKEKEEQILNLIKKFKNRFG